MQRSLYDILKKSTAEPTFEDVLLLPQHSNILPKAANIKTKIAKNFELEIPFISAAMDTITEAPMATAMALQGGLGLIHASFTIDAQANEVKKVKRFQAGFIKEPYTVSPEITINELVTLAEGYGVRTFPVTEDGTSHGKLVGMISRRDYSKEKHSDIKVKERMIPFDELLTATSDVTLELWNVPNAGSASDSNKLMDKVTIPASDFVQVFTDIGMETPGDTIQAKGSTNAALTINLYGAEIA